MRPRAKGKILFFSTQQEEFPLPGASNLLHSKETYNKLGTGE